MRSAELTANLTGFRPIYKGNDSSLPVRYIPGRPKFHFTINFLFAVRRVARGGDMDECPPSVTVVDTIFRCAKFDMRAFHRLHHLYSIAFKRGSKCNSS